MGHAGGLCLRNSRRYMSHRLGFMVYRSGFARLVTEDSSLEELRCCLSKCRYGRLGACGKR